MVYGVSWCQCAFSFALPRSPMAQPWAVIGGNAISALAGLLSTHLLGGLFIAIPFAVATPLFF